MKNKIYDKFINILFEPEEDKDNGEGIAVEPEDIEPVAAEPEIKPAVNETVEVQPTAKDVLYKKPAKTAFINYVDIPVDNVYAAKDKKQESEDETYEFSPNISPIFGVIGGNKKKTVVPKKVDTNQTKKPETHHLDIVTSPIYGYSRKEEAVKENPGAFHFEEEDDEEELHKIFETQDNLRIKDEEINLFDAYEEDL